MKLNSLFFALCLASQAIHAQGIVVDNTFGQNGRILTPLKVGNYGHSTFMDLTADQKIVTLSTEYANGQPIFCKYSENGDHLQSFQYPALNGVPLQGMAIKTLGDGRYLVATSEGLYRYLADGTIDPTFGTNGKADLLGLFVQEIVLSRSGRILAVGQTFTSSTALGDGAFVLAYDLDGKPDTSYGNGGQFKFHHYVWEFFNTAVEQPDGKLLIGGCIGLNTGMVNILMRLQPGGAADLSFGVNGLAVASDSDDGENYKVVLQTDGKILTCGDGADYALGAVARFLPNGDRDPDFGTNGNVDLPMLASAYDMITQPDGKILIFGPGIGGIILIRLLPNGILDPFFGFGGSYFLSAVDNLSSLKLALIENNKLIASTAEYDPSDETSYLQLHGFILDLNVGTVNPEEKPATWTYPNPVSDAVEVKFNLESPAVLQFELFDLQGNRLQILQEKTAFPSGQHTQALQLPYVPAGNYLLRVVGEAKPLTTIRLSKI